jgi:ATP phosphoribosyltransferase regulatory subunit
VPDGDAEAIALAVEALAAVGLPAPDRGSRPPRLRREVLRRSSFRTRPWTIARRCIAKHDGAGWRRAEERARLAGRGRVRRLLPELSGAPVVLDDARAQAPTAASSARSPSWRRSVTAVRARQADARLHVDLGEVRGFDYYTGVRFQVLRHRRGERGAAGRPLRRPARALRPSQPAVDSPSTSTPSRARWNRSHEQRRMTTWPS